MAKIVRWTSFWRMIHTVSEVRKNNLLEIYCVRVRLQSLQRRNVQEFAGSWIAELLNMRLTQAKISVFSKFNFGNFWYNQTFYLKTYLLLFFISNVFQRHQ